MHNDQYNGLTKDEIIESLEARLAEAVAKSENSEAMEASV